MGNGAGWTAGVYTIARLESNAHTDIVYTHIVTQADIAAKSIKNTAVVTDPSNPSNPQTPSTETAVRSFTATKTVDKTYVLGLGEELTYTIRVTNTGGVALENIKVEDVMGNGAGWTAGVYTIARLESNAHTDIVYTHIVTQADIAAKSIKNTAVVTDPSNPSNPQTPSTETVVRPNVILAKIDDFGRYKTYKGGLTGSVLDNDLLNGQVIHKEDVILTPGLSPVSGVKMNADGTISIDPFVKIGRYEYPYTICEKANPNNCSSSMAILVVEPLVLHAEDDNFGPYQGKYPNVTPSVLDNDNQEGTKVIPSEVILTYVSGDKELTLNGDGTIRVADRTRAGTYKLTYRICSTIDPSVCSEAVATVIIENDLFIPNVFTPNGDGNNDNFVIIGIEGFDRVGITIVNRWGNEVYRNENYDNTWNGRGLNEGTYYYIITTHKGGKSEVIKGWVLIKKR